MQIVINISEKEYNYYRDASNFWGYSKLREIIVNGTPLPKGHGRLIDADTLDDVVMRMNENGAQITRNEYKLIDNVIFEMLTIIEADKGGQANED